MKNFSFKRLTAWLLVFMTILSVVPASVLSTFAEELSNTGTTEDSGPIYVLAGGDYQKPGEHSGSAANVEAILNQIFKDYAEMNGFLFVGDYDCETHNNSDETSAGINSLLATIQKTYSNINHTNSILVQGNHDAMVTGIDVGGYELNGYAAYVLNEDQYPDGGGTGATVKALANSLEAWLDAKLAAGYSKPIFITSHLPLAYNTRTKEKGDGKYAKYIFDVLNEKAGEGLNIIFMHGHNHAYGYDEYLGGNAIYLNKGDEIFIAEEGSQTKYTAEKLNFTYMNAGYTGYYDGESYTPSDATNDTKELSMTVFKITGTDVEVCRYNAEGMTLLKEAGENKGQYINNTDLGSKLNTTEYTSPQKFNLTTVGLFTVWDENKIASFTSNKEGIVLTVENLGTVNTVANPHILYDIQAENYVEGDYATITLPVPDDYAMGLTSVYHISGEAGDADRIRTDIGGTVTVIGGQKVIKFTTNTLEGDFAIVHLSGAAAGVSFGLVEISSKEDGTQYRYVLDTDGIDYGSSNKYIIVARDAAKVLNATNEDGGTVENAEITDNTAIVSSRDYEYYFTTGNLITRDGTNTLYQQYWVIRYGYLTGSNLNGFTNYGNGYYRIYDTDGDARSMYYDGSKFNVTSADHTDEQYSVRLYKYDGTLGGKDLYAYTSGNYNFQWDYDTLIGETDEAKKAYALELIQKEITVWTTEVLSATEQNSTLINDSEVTWAWDNGVFNADSGYSTMTVSYQGKVLATVRVHIGDIAPYSNIWQFASLNDNRHRYTYSPDYDGVNASTPYLIVGNLYDQALNGAYGEEGTNAIPAQAIAMSGGNALTVTRNMEWIFTDLSGGSYTIHTVQNGVSHYLRNCLGTAVDLTTDKDEATRWHVAKASTDSNEFYYYISSTVGGEVHYLQFDSLNTGDHFITDTAQVRVRLFGFTKDEEISNDLNYAIAYGDKFYRVPLNSSTAWALQQIRAGITVYETDDPGTNDEEKYHAISNDYVEFRLDPSFTGTTFTERGYFPVTVIYKYTNKNTGVTSEINLGNVYVEVVGEDEAGIFLPEWVLADKGTTQTRYTYELDNNGINNGSHYAFADDNSDFIMGNTSSGDGLFSDNAVTITDNKFIVVGTNFDWTVTLVSNNSSYYSLVNGSNRLHVTVNGMGTNAVGVLTTTTTTTTTNANNRWYINHLGDGVYTMYVRTGNWNNYSYFYLYFDGSDFRVSPRQTSTDVETYTVRLYSRTGSVEETVGDSEYINITGTANYTVSAGSLTTTQIEAMIKDGVTAHASTKADGSSPALIADENLTWRWLDAIDPNKAGSYTMEILYIDTDETNTDEREKHLGYVEVLIEEKHVSRYSIAGEGWINQYSPTTTPIFSDENCLNNLQVITHYTDGSTSMTNLTLDMLSKDGRPVSSRTVGDITDCSVTYQGHNISVDFTLHINETYVNNYPEHPNEGAVTVNKTATGIDFQTTGVAQIELSASGVASKKGADVIIMVDTSSSMQSQNVTDTSNSRASVMEASLANLIKQLKQPGFDGEPLDIEVAIADFNGFYSSGTPYDRDMDDTMQDNISYNAVSAAKVYTGTGTLDVGAFQHAQDIADSYSFTYSSGTNYDYAMDAIYQLGTAARKYNEEHNEDRDLFVIFLSDGAPMQWNYYHSQGKSSQWNNWITGAWTKDQLTASNIGCLTHSYYYDIDDHDKDGMLNEHRMANAIKGSPDTLYSVIRKTNDMGLVTDKSDIYQVPGLGAKMWAISFDAQADTNVTAASMDKAISSLASEQTTATEYYYKVTSADELTNAFTQIGTEIAYAAENARFVDQLGDSFNLQMTVPKDKDGNIFDKNNDGISDITPMIELRDYDIWTRQDYENNVKKPDGQLVTLNDIGTRKGTYTVKEVVMFREEEITVTVDGKEEKQTVLRAYSNIIDANGDGIAGVILNNGEYVIANTANTAINGFTDNIIPPQDLETNSDATGIYKKGVIYGRYFLYNTNTFDVTVTIYGNPITIAAESFYWNIGTITTTEQALRYYVYLDGAMEGTKKAGSYATNNYATLYYDNYLGNECRIDTTSPSVAWLAANVSYGFYLVNDQGKVVINKNDGSVGSFSHKIAVTSSIVYDEVLLNNVTTVRSINVANVANSILPDGYELFDPTAEYYIEIGSGTNTSNWKITANEKILVGYGPDGKEGTDDDVYAPNTTYVTQYKIDDPTAFSNQLEFSSDTTEGSDFTHTIVWFAVKWENQALPDTVVIDYGLPVDISVLVNDMLGETASLQGIAVYDEEAHAGYISDPQNKLHDGFAAQAQGKFGTATASTATGFVRYKLNTMAMNGVDKFTYAVRYIHNNTATYYYDTVTVIPATSIYFEESLVTFNNSSAATDTMGIWQDTGAFDENATQGEDRPDIYSLSQVDRNWVYGFDGINSGSTTYSMGNAKWVNVDAATGKPSTAPSAQFTFTGTGFDIISMTDNTSGTIIVTVTDENNTVVSRKSVNNYYGYKYEDTDGDGVKEWISDSTSTGKIYQVPVIKLSGLDHGTYHVTIQVAYMTAFDHQPNDSLYTFVLDSIRIYDPVNPAEADTVITDAYKADGEFNPTYTLIKDQLLAGIDLENNPDATINGVVFIDGQDGAQSAFDYKNMGPNNELYLAVNQHVSFKIQTNFEPDKTMIGVKLATGTAATLKVSYTTTDENDKEHTITNGKTIATATDMYYELAAITWTRSTQTDESGNVTYLDKWESPIITLTNGEYVANLEEYAESNILSLTNIKITEKQSDGTKNTIEGKQTENNTTPASASYEAIVTDGMLAPEINDGDIAPTPIEGSIEAAAPAFEEVETPAPETVEESEEPEADTAVEVIDTDTPNTITLIVDQEVIDHANFILNPVFEPEYIQYKTKKVGFGSFATNYLLVVTSNDVASLTANGVALTKVTSNYQVTTRFGSMRSLEKEFGVDIDGGEYTMWMYSSKDASFEIVAGNSEGICSEPVAAEVASSGGIGSFFGSLIGSVLDSFFGKKETAEEIEVPDYSEIMKQLAQRYFNPEKFEAKVGERADGKKQLVIEASEDVAYVIVNGKIIRNYITETVVDLENNGEETVKRIFVAYVSGEGSVDIAAYNAEGVASSAKVAEN